MSKIDKSLIKKLIKEIIKEDDDLILNAKDRKIKNDLEKNEKNALKNLKNDMKKVKLELVNEYVCNNFINMENDTTMIEDMEKGLLNDYNKIKNYKEKKEIDKNSFYFENDFTNYYLYKDYKVLINELTGIIDRYERELRDFINRV